MLLIYIWIISFLYLSSTKWLPWLPKVFFSFLILFKYFFLIYNTLSIGYLEVVWRSGTMEVIWRLGNSSECQGGHLVLLLLILDQLPSRIPQPSEPSRRPSWSSDDTSDLKMTYRYPPWRPAQPDDHPNLHDFQTSTPPLDFIPDLQTTSPTSR